MVTLLFTCRFRIDTLGQGCIGASPRLGGHPALKPLVSTHHAEALLVSLFEAECQRLDFRISGVQAEPEPKVQNHFLSFNFGLCFYLGVWVVGAPLRVEGPSLLGLFFGVLLLISAVLT